MTRCESDAGVTLLELAAVMAIFSVVSLMGVQLLSQAIANREVLSNADARISALTGTVAVLRRDLENTVPQPDPTGTAPVFAMSDSSLRLDVRTQAGIETVIWRVAPGQGQLLREYKNSDTSTVILPDVSAMQITVLDGTNWIIGDGWRPDGPADLPRGIRVILSLRDLGDIPIVVAR